MGVEIYLNGVNKIDPAHTISGGDFGQDLASFCRDVEMAVLKPLAP
jgi:hypothetical protein